MDTKINFFGSYPTYEEWKLCLLFITKTQVRVLILPMRNGNQKAVEIVNDRYTIRSYPTYEEWKLSSLSLFILSTPFCSYPTYEEWKPPLTRLINS